MEFLKLTKRKSKCNDTMGVKMSKTIRLEDSEGKIRKMTQFSGIYYLGQWHHL